MAVRVVTVATGARIMPARIKIVTKKVTIDLLSFFGRLPPLFGAGADNILSTKKAAVADMGTATARVFIFRQRRGAAVRASFRA